MSGPSEPFYYLVELGKPTSLCLNFLFLKTGWTWIPDHYTGSLQDPKNIVCVNTTHVSFDGWLDNEDVVLAIWLSHKKGWNIAISINMDESGEYQWTKISQTEKLMIWFHSYVGYKTESNKHTKKQLRNTENSMVVTRGVGEWGEDEESKGDQIYDDGRKLDCG